MQNRDEKLQQARERHGKPFVHEVPVKRATRQSWLLRQINRKSQPARGNVIAFGVPVKATKATKEGAKCTKTR